MNFSSRLRRTSELSLEGPKVSGTRDWCVESSELNEADCEKDDGPGTERSCATDSGGLLCPSPCDDGIVDGWLKIRTNI